MPRLVLVRDVLWYTVNKRDLLRLVIVRDPDGIEPDDFFITTDRTATGAQVASRYAGRWSIEVCFLLPGFRACGMTSPDPGDLAGGGAVLPGCAARGW